MKVRKVWLALCFLFLSYQYWVNNWNNTCGRKIFHGLFLLLCSLIFFRPWWPSFWMSFLLSIILVLWILILSRLCPCIVYILHVALMFLSILFRNLRWWHIGSPLWIYQLSLWWILTLSWLLLPEVHLLKLIISSFLFNPPASLLNLSVLLNRPNQLSLVWFHFFTPCGLYLLQSTSQRSHRCMYFG